HREDFARERVHHDEAAAGGVGVVDAALEFFDGDALELEVDREADVVAASGGGVPAWGDPERTARGIADVRDLSRRGTDLLVEVELGAEESVVVDADEPDEGGGKLFAGRLADAADFQVYAWDLRGLDLLGTGVVEDGAEGDVVDEAFDVPV